MISSTVCLTLKSLYLVLEEEPHKTFIVAKSPLESKFEKTLLDLKFEKNKKSTKFPRAKGNFNIIQRRRKMLVIKRY